MPAQNIKKLVENLPSSEHWNNFGTCPRSGVVEYTARLATEDDWGIGDFDAVKQFLDICAEAGMSVFQFLPLNDTGADSSPYCTISAFAIDPKYISITAMLDYFITYKIGITKKLKKDLDKLKNEIKSSERVIEKPCEQIIKGNKITFSHPEMVDKKKFSEIKEIKYKAYRMLWKKAEKNLVSEVKNFTLSHWWMKGYSLYCVLFEKFNCHWEDWADEYKYPDQKKLDKLYKENKKDCLFYEFLQLMAFIQLQVVHKKADQLGIKLIGDLPLLLNRGSAEVWTDYTKFRLDLAAGAPPDQFTEDGQNWGFCPYNWPVMKQDDYKLIKSRMAFASNFYDANRIDHILGDFRVWSMQHLHKDRKIWKELASDGFYFPQIPVHGDELAQALGYDLKTLVDYGAVIPITPEMLGEYEIPWGYGMSWNYNKTDLYKALDKEGQQKWDSIFKWYKDARQEELWTNHGTQILKLKLEAAPQMLPIGEDLGDVPDYVRETLSDLGIPGMKVLRWENSWNPSRKRVSMTDPETFNPISMATIGAHDAETMRHWWETPNLNDIETDQKAIFKSRRDTLSEDLGIPLFDVIDQQIYNLIIENAEKLDYLTRKVDIYTPELIEAFFNTPFREDYYLSILERRTMEKKVERQNVWEDLGFSGPAPEKMPVSAMKQMIEASMYSSSILVVNPLTDLLGVWGLTCSDPRNDRINKPGFIDEQNWETRLPYTVKELKCELRKPSMTKPTFTRIQEARAMIEAHGRLPYQMVAIEENL